MRKAAHPSGYAKCGAGVCCLAIRYRSLLQPNNNAQGGRSRGLVFEVDGGASDAGGKALVWMPFWRPGPRLKESYLGLPRSDELGGCPSRGRTRSAPWVLLGFQE